MTLKHFLKGFGIFAILITLAPLIAVDYWWIRIFDYPHVQLTFITALAIVVYFIKIDFKNTGDYIFIIILTACFIFQFVKFFSYSKFAEFDMLNSSTNKKIAISILTANVHQDNEDMDKIIEAINNSNADFMIFTEANKRWQKAISNSISEDYLYKLEYPLDNTYGMLMYSKFETIDPGVEFLVKSDIPSIHTKVITREGDTIQIHAIHPTPPMPTHNPMSTNRDAEMMKVAKRVMDTKLPTIVLGDFNDVPWSETTKLFKLVSKTLDPRIGRGLYSTYNAQKFLLRWPLDHIFCTKEFRLKTFKTYSRSSSDHFPVYGEFTLEPKLSHLQEVEQPTEEDVKRANNQIKKK